MRNRLLLVLLLVLIVLPNRSFADFRPVNPEELKITSLPNEPGATAFILDHEETYSNDGAYVSVYFRIKILTEAGRALGNVEIPYFGQWSDIIDIRGRTIHSDGTIIPFDGKPLEKIIEKDRDVRYKAKIIAMPDVQVGSIVEYEYARKYRYYWGPYSSSPAPRWILQQSLFQRHVHFAFRRSGTPFAYTWVTPNNEKPTDNGIDIELTLKDVPAFFEEEYMPPPDMLKYHVFFYYTDVQNTEEYWKEAGKSWAKSVDYFAKESGALKTALSGIVSPSDTQEQKVRKIYDFVQKFENTTYLPSRSPDEMKARGLKESRNGSDVLKQKSGNRDDITQLFIGLVRAAGIHAYAMRVVARDRSYFLPTLMDFGQLDYEIAIVQLDGKEVFLDPGTRFCPYGLLYWKGTASRGVRQTPDGKTAIALSGLANYKDSQIQRILNLAITSDLQGEGVLNVFYFGQAAVVMRLGSMNTDAAGRKKKLEDQVKTWLPDNSEVTLTNQPDWESDKTLVASFKIKTPLVSSSGKRLFLPAQLMARKYRDAFVHAERKYPVYFDYPFTQVDEIHILLPDKYQVEMLPVPAQQRIQSAVYSTSYSQSGKQLILRREFAISGNYFEAPYYQELRSFFQKTRDMDQQQILLKMAADAAGN